MDSSSVVTIDTTAPTETTPGAQYDPISGDGAIIFGSVHGNRITVSDNNDDKLTVRITVDDGLLNLNGPMLNVTVAGLNTSQMTIAGLARDIDTAINNHLSYTAVSFKVGAADRMRVEATDLAGNLSSASIDISVTCFMAGTRIKTPTGEAKVETLRRGDLVLTADGRSLPVDWLGRQTVSTLFGDVQRVLPIRIKAGALADNVPCRDLLISPDHAILIDGVLAQAAALVNGTSIARERAAPTVFIYYHVELEDHSLILAENVPVETFVDNIDRRRFDNWDEHLALYPEGKAIGELPYPRAKSRRQAPMNLRVRLDERAGLIGAAGENVARSGGAALVGADNIGPFQGPMG
ncbi:Hint domain-containing protein [uncultured Rhodoblastus sp.]|uniref:Hint domain-containing protein n=1 Tax=uncultured Rhodoblastus sp. TaxID=543037 RepID=UPI0025F8229F|nr:Hint domain-containing protein [uncultured Rhodoblastus sp.]